MIKRLLAHPLTRGLSLDDPSTTHLRRSVIASKPFLKQIYQEWYQLLTSVMPAGPGGVLELGSGAGFLAEYVPDLITSEIFYLSSIQAVLDGCFLPFPAASLRAVMLTDVLHHIPAARRFFAEAGRCVRPGGVVAMIEPWVSPWSTLVYTRLHHEPFVPDTPGWEFTSLGPLTSANGAMPWIIFERDRLEFERAFPEWQIERIAPMMPFRYLLSGGISLRSLMPGFSFGFWRLLEQALQPQMKNLAMFALIVLRRKNL